MPKRNPIRPRCHLSAVRRVPSCYDSGVPVMSRLVPDPSAERLNERQQPDHRGFRRDSQEWLHDQDYSNSVVGRPSTGPTSGSGGSGTATATRPTSASRRQTRTSSGSPARTTPGHTSSTVSRCSGASCPTERRTGHRRPPSVAASPRRHETMTEDERTASRGAALEYGAVSRHDSLTPEERSR